MAWILGLPVGGVDFNSLKYNKKDICTKYGLKGCNMKRKELVIELKSTDVGERWQALFLMLAIDYVLRPSYTYNVSHDVLKVMSQRQNMRCVNWSKFVLDGVIKAASDKVYVT